MLDQLRAPSLRWRSSWSELTGTQCVNDQRTKSAASSKLSLYYARMSVWLNFPSTWCTAFTMRIAVSESYQFLNVCSTNRIPRSAVITMLWIDALNNCFQFFLHGSVPFVHLWPIYFDFDFDEWQSIEYGSRSSQICLFIPWNQFIPSTWRYTFTLTLSGCAWGSD